ncbi:hypothetical protein FIBSPDRAFT_1053818 [Athelia psychrophila]|uniref:Uncharacterized protein n=1 Tax=Athelia psychrophila TaxID=1759441 RepID=A0A167WCS1_9AGAM|nr:hypothetical protein FIBSPDRAFT_1053818 [Fibularhizoctonia sp. CBS 109695]
MTCPGTSLPSEVDGTAFYTNLNSTLFAAFNGSLQDEVSVYCAANANVCFGICPNADIAGVGVRVAFYINAIFTALLVALSPDESPSAAWASTLLTIAMVVPAIIQKKQKTLTLYHATLVLNFATFSSISSLAVAPLCTVWRQIDNKDHPGHVSHTITPNQRSLPLPVLTHQLVAPPPAPVKTTEPQRHRARIILSFALIAQISLQWAWATYLFTSPYYAQEACSPETRVVLFFVSMKAMTINEGQFALWGCWLLFSISVTLLFGILLVLSSTSGANGNRQPKKPLRKPKTSWITRTTKKWDPRGNKRRAIVFVFAVLICSALVFVSERQAHDNCVSGDNDSWGFGQIAALLFALAPLWSIVESEGGQRYYKRFTDFLGKIHHYKLAHAVDPSHTSASSEFGHQSSSSQDVLIPLLPYGHSASPSFSPANTHSPSISRQQSPNASELSSPRHELWPQISNLSLNAHGRSDSLLSELSVAQENHLPSSEDEDEDDHFWDASMLLTHPPRLASDSSSSLRPPSPTPIPLIAPSITVIPPSMANSRAPSPSPSNWGGGEEESPLSPSTRNLINFSPI